MDRLPLFEEGKRYDADQRLIGPVLIPPKRSKTRPDEYFERDLDKNGRPNTPKTRRGKDVR